MSNGTIEKKGLVCRVWITRRDVVTSDKDLPKFQDTKFVSKKAHITKDMDLSDISDYEAVKTFALSNGAEPGDIVTFFPTANGQVAAQGRHFRPQVLQV